MKASTNAETAAAITASQLMSKDRSGFPRKPR
jgi:hypothetical protein